MNIESTLAAKAWNLMQQATKVVLLTHQKPDGDGISACVALELVLTRLGKQVQTVYPSAPEFAYARQPQNLLVNQHNLQPDLLIACDTANYARLYFPEAFKQVPLVNIDHHISNSLKATVDLVDAQSSSTCELLTQLLQVWAPEQIDKPVAEALLFGMLYDTQVFQITSTTATTLRLAAQLMDVGADLNQLERELLCHMDPKIIKLWSELMADLIITPNGKAVVASIKLAQLKKYGLTPSSLVGFNNFLAQICGVDVTVLCYEQEDGSTKVSLRSKATDVNALAQKFGGGGHVRASGITSLLSVDELIRALLPLL